MKYNYYTEVSTVRELREVLSHFEDDAVVLVEDSNGKKKIDFVDCIGGNKELGLKPQVLLNIDVEEC